MNTTALVLIYAWFFGLGVMLMWLRFLIKDLQSQVNDLSERIAIFESGTDAMPKDSACSQTAKESNLAWNKSINQKK